MAVYVQRDPLPVPLEVLTGPAVSVAHVFAANAELIVISGLPAEVNDLVVDFVGPYTRYGVSASPCSYRIGPMVLPVDLGLTTAIVKDIRIWYGFLSRRRRCAVQVACLGSTTRIVHHTYLAD